MRPAKSEKIIQKYLPSPPSIPYKHTANGYQDEKMGEKYIPNPS